MIRVHLSVQLYPSPKPGHLQRQLELFVHAVLRRRRELES